MNQKRRDDEPSIKTLEQQLYLKKRAWRQNRWQRLRENGRIVQVKGFPPPISQPHQTNGHVKSNLDLASQSINDTLQTNENSSPKQTKTLWQFIANKTLFLVEITAVVGLLIILLNLWRTQNSLNQEVAQVQKAQSQALALPTPAATPVIDVVVLPGGHKPPIEGVVPQPGEAGDIPAHLLPAVNAYQPPPQPTPFPEMARRIQIPAINVDSPIVQGMYDWEQLKKGVAQKIGSAGPGEVGNMSLAAHNDIYGEIFRYLDQLTPGDEIIISTERQTYTYIIREIDVVEPTNVSVLNPTDYPSTTLISCYPYRVNTKRIVVFADLVET